MRRPLVLATALAAELAVGTLALAPHAAAQTAPDVPPDARSVAPGDVDPGSGEPSTDPATDPDPDPDPADPGPLPAPVRTGRSDPAPVEVPAEVPDIATAAPAPVRSGRLDAAPGARESGDTSASGRQGDSIPRSVGATARAPSDAPKASSPRDAQPSAPAPGSTADAPATSDAAPTPVPTGHVVAEGDHLWAIAAQQVAAASGRAPSDLAAGDVVTYWVQLCMMNRPHLRSGNPSRIYPGEVIELPPVT